MEFAGKGGWAFGLYIILNKESWIQNQKISVG